MTEIQPWQVDLICRLYGPTEAARAIQFISQLDDTFERISNVVGPEAAERIQQWANDNYKTADPDKEPRGLPRMRHPDQ